MPADYLAVGDPTLDHHKRDGLVLGGSSVYGAVQAARLGLNAAIVGRGNGAELAPHWQPYSAEVRLLLEPSESVTKFRNVITGEAREQWLLEWAGKISAADELPDSSILHLAPVAQEIDLELFALKEKWSLVCLTPQGLVRRWDNATGHIDLVPRSFSAAAASFVDVVVVSKAEAPCVADLLVDVSRRGGLAVVTYGASGCKVLTKYGTQSFPADSMSRIVDETGAGDCFACCLTAAVYWGLTLKDSIKLATVAAAACIEGTGATAVATIDELLDRVGSASLDRHFGSLHQ